MNEFHVPQIAALEKLCFSDPWSENSIASELNNPLSLWLVAMDGEGVVGYIGSQSVMGESDMMNVAVHPDHRRKGYAEALVLALSEELKKQQDSVLCFLEECDKIKISPTAKIHSKKLYELYQDFCEGNLLVELKSTTFVTAVKTKGKSKGIRHSTNIKIGNERARGFEGIGLSDNLKSISTTIHKNHTL